MQKEKEESVGKLRLTKQENAYYQQLFDTYAEPHR